MKIKKEVLATFLKKSIMSGPEQIEEAVFKFEKEGLKINANCVSTLARSMSWLKTSAFTEYEEMGNVGMNDLNNVVSVLERFGEFVNLSKEGNLLTIKGDGKKVDIELVAENFLKTDEGEPKLEFAETINLKSGKLADLFADVTMNKDATIKFETKEKILEVSNTGKYKFLNTIEAPSCKGGVVVTFGEPLINATTKLKGEVEISIKTNYPMKIREVTEHSVISIIVAPRIEGDE